MSAAILPNSTPTPAPEALAAQVRAMLAPFFRGPLPPAPVLADPTGPKHHPAPAAAVAREQVEA